MSSLAVVLEEVARRYSRPAPVRPRLEGLLATLQPHQRAFVESTARKQALLGTRRSGKTTMAPVGLLKSAESNPGCVTQYLGRTRLRAKQLAWAPLVEANNTYSLGYRVNATELTLSHPTNGAVVRLDGLDNLSELEKKRGDKLAEVWLDEVQSIPEDVLKKAVESVLWPALMDVSGLLRLLGSPGYVCQGLWYEVTRNEDAASFAQRAKGWAVSEWSGLSNFALNHKGECLSDLFRAELNRLLDDPARGPQDASVLREWLGRWTNDLKALYYAFSPDRNLYDGTLPPGHAWRYTMGVDLGGKYARVTWAFSDTHPNVYEVDGLKEAGTNANHWRQHTVEGQARFPVDSTVVDYGGLGVGIVEGWQEDGLPVRNAEKHHKDAYVALFNAELLAGRVKALRGGALAGEWATLPKDPDSPPGKPPQPRQGFDDHSSDAALYAWRDCRPLVPTRDSPAPAAGTTEAYAAERKAEKQRWLAEQSRKRQEYE